jgi:hypothetical protein
MGSHFDKTNNEHATPQQFDQQYVTINQPKKLSVFGQVVTGSKRLCKQQSLIWLP